jgi:hypothetical protein
MDYYIHVRNVQGIGFRAGIQATYEWVSLLSAGV